MSANTLYYYTTKSRKEMIHELSKLLNLEVEHDQYVYTLKHKTCYLGIQINEEAADAEESIEVGECHKFPYFIDISCDSDEDEALPIVKQILEHLWHNNVPAIAEGDLESQLPYGGGHEKNDMMWPSVGITTNTES